MIIGNMKIQGLFISLLLSLSCWMAASQDQDYGFAGDRLNLYLANDLGRNGYYDQKPIAELMGNLAGEIDPEAVIAIGDVHHFEGIRSTGDPLWMTNFELVYSHPDLMIPWHPVLGNHEYRVNTDAVLEYADVSRRWEMPGRYYSISFEDEGTSIRVIFLDTTPMIDKYREESLKYPDAHRQNISRQLRWLERQLEEAREDWVVVVGHHPIYAGTSKDEEERTDLQARLDPVLRRHRVDMYVAGHVHNFQHIRADGSDNDYVVNSSASLSRPDIPDIPGMVFRDGHSGFSVLSADSQTLELRMIDAEGRVLHTIIRTRIIP